MNANEMRERILAAPDAEPGDEVKWTPEDQAWLDRFMLARDAFHAAAGELVPGWDRDNPNRLSLHLQVLKATGLQPEAFHNLMQMDEIRVIREAAKMKREEREALVAGLRSCTPAPTELPQDRPQTPEEIKGWKLARALDLLSRGWSVPDIADDIHVVRSTLYRWTDFRKAQKRLSPGH